MSKQALCTLEPNHFYLGYIIYPDELHQSTPPNTSYSSTPTTLTSFPAKDPRNPPNKRLRDPKYHPVLVHQFAQHENIATVFVCNTNPSQHHRFCPLVNSARLQSQPEERIFPEPPGVFEDEGSYINFSHPIRCSVAFKSASILRQEPPTIPGRALHVGLKGAKVVLPPAEKKKLMKLHWDYWAGKRYEGATSEADEEDGGKGEKQGEDDDGNSEGTDDEGGQEGEDGGNAGEADKPEGGEAQRKYWRDRVHEALNNPDVPEEDEPDTLPVLMISHAKGDPVPEESKEGTPAEWEEWARKYGHRIV